MLTGGMATAADWMSAASYLSMAGLISFMGFGGAQYLMGWTGGYVLLALLLAPYLRKFGKFTVPEFIGDRFYSQTARMVAVLCLIVASVTYVIGQMRGAGIAFSRFLEVDISTGLFIGMAVVFTYAVVGGMKGITYTQIAQYCVMIFAYTVPAIFISLQVTGVALPQIGLGATVADGTWLLEKVDGLVTDLGFSAYTEPGGMSMLNMFLLTMALMIGTAGLPHVIIRFFTVPKVRDARKSAGWALVFIAILYTTAPAVGAMAMYNLLNTVQPGEVGTEQGSLLAEERPEWMRTWEETGLLVYEDKNNDGRIQYYNDENPAMEEALLRWKFEFYQQLVEAHSARYRPPPAEQFDLISVGDFSGNPTAAKRMIECEIERLCLQFVLGSDLAGLGAIDRTSVAFPNYPVIDYARVGSLQPIIGFLSNVFDFSKMSYRMLPHYLGGDEERENAFALSGNALRAAGAPRNLPASQFARALRLAQGSGGRRDHLLDGAGGVHPRGRPGIGRVRHHRQRAA